MAEIKVEIARTDVADLPFPPFEDISDKVRRVVSGNGRDYELDEIDVGTATVDIEVERDDDSFILDTNEPLHSDDYANGFSYAGTHHLSSADKRYSIKFDSVYMTSNPTSTAGIVETLLHQNSGNEAAGWYLSDEIYWAPVKEFEQYVFAYVFKEPDKSGGDAVFKDQGYATWYTDKGIRIQSDRFSFVDTPNSTADLQVKGKVTAPAGAAYATIGSTPFTTGGFGTSVKGYRTLRWSNLQIHKYDAAYESANGGEYRKPFTLDNLTDHAADGGTPIRIVSPGNQFNMDTWYPTQLIGSGSRPRTGYQIMQSAYNMETLTSGTIASWFSQNRCTLSVNTATVYEGTKSLGVVTNSDNANPVDLYWSVNTSTMWTPVQPGQTYRISFAVNNTGAGSATFQLRVKHDINISSEAAQVGTTTKSTGTGWSLYSHDWVCPAGVYGAFFLLRFSAAGYTLAIDDINIECLGTELDLGDNLMPYFGDLESLDTISARLEATSASGSTFYIIDDSANAHSGRRYLSLVKPGGTPDVNVVFGNYLGHAHCYTDGGDSGRTYRLSFWAKTSVSITGGVVVPLYKLNNTAHDVGFTSMGSQGVSTTWTKYTFDYTVTAGLTGSLLVIAFAGDTATAANLYIDDIKLEKFPSGISESLSSVGSGTRTTIYESEFTSGYTVMMYGNDEFHDDRFTNHVYHSGKTRTRYKATLTSAGHDFTGTASLFWLEVLGHTRRVESPGFLAGNHFFDSNITLPTTGSPTTINALAPDIPDVAFVPMIVFYGSDGAYTFGYTFTDEYIGPDGYENDPDVLERVWFRGLVEERRDTVSSMSIDGKRVINVQLDCVDLFGALQSVELNTPYSSVVLRDKPMAYFPFNDDPSREIGEMTGRTEFTSKAVTIGSTGNYGVTADSENQLLAGNEGGSYKFTPQLGGFDGGFITIKENTWGPATVNAGSFECWFKSNETDGDWDPPNEGRVLVSQHQSDTVTETGVYVWFVDGNIRIGWGASDFGIIGDMDEIFFDGLSHHLVLTHGGALLYLYIDGVLVYTTDYIIETELFHDVTSIGGFIRGEYNWTFNGWVSHVAFYDRQLTSGEIQEHHLVGRLGGLGDDEVTRLNYVLGVTDVAGVPSTVKDRDGNTPVPATTLDYMNWSVDASPLSELKNTAFTDAGGLIYALGNDMVYEPRQTRWNRGMYTTSWEIGAGLIEPELPMSSNPDVSKVVNEITINRQSQSDFKVVNHVSQRRYRRLAKNMDIDTESVDDAKYRAQWIVNTTGQPVARYGSITFKDIGANSTFCRDVRISDYLHGILSNEYGIDEGVLDHFVESVKHEWVRNGGALQHNVTIEISPAGNKTVWILEDAIYGEIDNPDIKLAY